ncbi:LysE family translocator [Rossellomorea marisflavi]|uniref:LysE family translocator n=1 Tax=Rossellomorea marisflavi TaxID=189381 RepID=UPI00345995DC
MSIFFSYIFLGLSLSAPMGPINAAQLDKGIRYGFWHSWLVGVGGMGADAIFMLAIYFGLAPFIDTPIIQLILWMSGAFILIFTGIESIARSHELIQPQQGAEGESKKKSLWTGFIMALSNPLSIIFWLGIYGSILAQTTSSYGTGHVLLYSLGIFIGITIWDITMAFIATGAKKYVRPGALRLISILSGVVMFGFGIYFAIRAADVLFS